MDDLRIPRAIRLLSSGTVIEDKGEPVGVFLSYDSWQKAVEVLKDYDKEQQRNA